MALNSSFDVLWSVAHNYAGFEGPVHVALFAALRSGLEGLTKRCDAFLKAKPSASSDAYKQELERFQQPLKMLVYILNMAIVEGEKMDLERVKAQKGRRGKPKAADLPDGWLAGTKLKEKTLMALLQLLDLDLARFWGLSYPEDEFNILLTRIAGAMMENPANLKQKAVKSDLFLLFARLVQKYNQSIHVTPLISNQLHNHEHVAEAFAALMYDMATKNDNLDFVGGVVREIGRLDLVELSKDSGAAKNVAAFIVSLAGLLPKVVLQNISMLVPQLDAELYVLRNGVIEAMGELILKGFDPQHLNKEEGSNGAAQTRDKLFDYLQDRFLDTNAFSRTRTMRTWTTLVEAGVVPKDIFLAVTDLTVRRLNDKGANVRKEALRLLTKLLEHNPLCPILNLAKLRSRLDAVEARLAQVYAELNAAPPVAPADKENASAATNNDGEQAGAQPAAAPQAPQLTQEKAAALAADLAERQLFQMTLKFAETLDRAAAIMCRMMGSKNKTDVVEAVNFFTTAKNFQLQGAEKGFRMMLSLLWSKEAAIKVRRDMCGYFFFSFLTHSLSLFLSSLSHFHQDAVVAAYKDAYLSTIVHGNETLTQRDAAFRIAGSLISLTEGSTLSQLTSLELLMAEFTRAELIEPNVINALWTLFASASTADPIQDPAGAAMAMQKSRGAIALLSMIAVVKPETVRDHVDKLALVGLMDRSRWYADPPFAKAVCAALQKMGGTEETLVRLGLCFLPNIFFSHSHRLRACSIPLTTLCLQS